MPVTEFKNIPSRAQWTKARDAAGGKSNLVSSVNIGKTLESFDKLRSPKEREKGLQELEKVFVTYTANAAVKKIPDLHKTAMSIFKVVKTEQLAMKQNKDIGLAIGLKVGDGLRRLALIDALLKKNEVEKARDTYGKFWDGIGRGVGQQLQGGTIRTNWQNAHGQQPTRNQVDNLKTDKEKATAIGLASAAYKVALKKLLQDAQDAGIECKLG